MSLSSTAPPDLRLPYLPDTLCYIVAKVLANRVPTRNGWVRWSPTAPLHASLVVLVAPRAATVAWYYLLTHGWVQARYDRHGMYFRLTPLGWRMVQTPPLPLPCASDWHRAILAHLHTQSIPPCVAADRLPHFPQP